MSWLGWLGWLGFQWLGLAAELKSIGATTCGGRDREREGGGGKETAAQVARSERSKRIDRTRRDETGHKPQTRHDTTGTGVPGCVDNGRDWKARPAKEQNGRATDGFKHQHPLPFPTAKCALWRVV